IVVTGNVSCEGDLQISGRVEGEVRGATVFVDQGGVIDGAIEAERLRVCGAVNGSITVNDLAVEAGGVVAGETSYERPKGASGGLIEGSFAHRRSHQPAEVEPPLKLVTSPAPANPRHVFVD
ncbi:polymer-forming cytoskeletal protein, partial [Bacillus licheniformis]|uniref:bactofilin family protein n=1 Tax=Bacillus licheniformis TaxID=1402 RepID=UPI00237D01AE